MNKIAYSIVHYGAPYLKQAVEAIRPQVDKVVILYSPTPSQGFTTNLVCPDTEEELKALVGDAEWVKGDWKFEGEHNDAILNYNQGYDWTIRFDADEIYPEGSVDYFISEAEKTSFKDFRVPFIHFWRSFEWACFDSQFPIRLLRKTGELTGWIPDKEEMRVLHLGYAQPTNYILYKMEVQAHRPEWRKEWLGDIWHPFAKADIHPVSYGLWNAEPYDKTKLPEVLKKHPYYEMEKIE